MTKDVLGNLIRLIETHVDHVVELRHRLHRFPEPGFRETTTASVLTEELCSIPHIEFASKMLDEGTEAQR